MLAMRFSLVLTLIVAAATAFSASPAAAAVLGLHAFVAPADRGIAADVATVRDMRDIRDFGAMAATKPVEIGLLLRVRNEAQLQSLIVAQGNRTSSTSISRRRSPPTRARSRRCSAVDSTSRKRSRTAR
jgi:hypothetical protein